MANPVEKKFRERLKKFLSEKNIPKKWKAMTKIIDKESPENVTQLFLKQQDDIIFTVTKFQQSLEQTKDAEKTKKQQEIDALDLHRILKLVLERLSNLIKTRFKYQDISQCIMRSLAKQNKHCVRKAALESLMIFIEVLIQQPGREVDEMLALFSNSVILNVFVPEISISTGVQIKVRNQPPTVEEAAAIYPAGAEPTPEEQKDLFSSILDFVASRVGKGNLFEFWFETLNRAYFFYLYPEVFKQLGSLPPGEMDLGFTTFCPHLLQQAIIDKLDLWKENVPICETLFSDRYYPFTLEIFNQSCRLPVTFLATIKKSLEIFKHFLITKRKPNVVRDHLVQGFWRSFIQSMALVFTIDSTPAQSDGHAQLFQEVFSSVDMFTLQLSGVLEEATWKTLQYTLLDGTISFLNKNQMSILSDSKTDVVRMADPLISYLFSAWIRSPVTTPDMWRDLHMAFVTITDWPHAVRQWKIKVVSLTEILVRFFHARHTEYVMPTDLATEDLVGMFLGVPYWTKEHISKLWYTVLNVAGNINAIKSAYNFEVAMRCVQEVVGLLLQAEASIPLREEPRRMPPIDVFLPWLMEACFATGEKIRGAIISFAVLSQLFCTQHSKLIAPELLTHFFRAIQFGLRHENPLIRDQIMAEAKYVFSHDLPGSAVLIPEFITEVNNIFKVRQGATAEMQKNAVSVLNALICYPHHFDGVMVPDVIKNREINSGELREALSTLLVTILNIPSIAPAAKVMNIWGSCVFLYEEIYNQQPRVNFIGSCIQAIVNLTRHNNELVTQAAGEALQTLSHLFPAISAIDRSIALTSLSMMCDSLSTLFQEGVQSGSYKEPIMVLLFEAINAWILAGSSDFLREKTLSTKLFTVIEFGVLGQSVDVQKPSMTLSRVKTEEDLTTAPFYFLIEQLDSKPTHNVPSIKAAAEILLHSVLNWQNNFPTPVGAAQLDATVVEDIDRPIWAFSLNHEKVLTFQDVVDATGQPAVRVVSRDTAGKHVWMFRHNIMPDQNAAFQKAFDPPITTELPIDNTIAPDNSKKRSPLSAMLQHFNQAHADILPQTPKFVKFDAPVRPDARYASEVEGGKKLLTVVDKIESDVLSRFREARFPLDKDLITPAKPLSGLARARWLLSHFGFLSPLSRRILHALEDTPELRMALRSLDRQSSRERFDVGVLYVASLQETVEEAVTNRQTSLPFSHLVDGLGWKVNPAVHPGYRADLTADDCPAVPYYADARMELAFHVSPMLTGSAHPIISSLDADYTQIVWSEHKRDFIMPAKPNPPVPGRDIATDSYIVVYPLINGLFRIQVQKRDTIAPFGPLLTGMVVTKKLLPALLRATCFISNRRSLKLKQPEWKHPMFVRAQTIREFTSTQKKLRAPELFYSHLFPSDYEEPKATLQNMQQRQIAAQEINRRRGDSLIQKTVQPPPVALPGSVMSTYMTAKPQVPQTQQHWASAVDAEATEASPLTMMPTTNSTDSEKQYDSQTETTEASTSMMTFSTLQSTPPDMKPLATSPGTQTVQFSLADSNTSFQLPSGGMTKSPSNSAITLSPLGATSSPSSGVSSPIGITSPPATAKMPIGFSRPVASSVAAPRPMVGSTSNSSLATSPPGIGANAKFGNPMANRAASVAVPPSAEVLSSGPTSPRGFKLPPGATNMLGPQNNAAPQMATSPPTHSPLTSPPMGMAKGPVGMPGRPMPAGASPSPFGPAAGSAPPKFGSQPMPQSSAALPHAGGMMGGMTSPPGMGTNRPLGAPPGGPAKPIGMSEGAPGPAGLNRTTSSPLGPRPMPPGGAPTPGVGAPAPGGFKKSPLSPPMPGPAPSPGAGGSPGPVGGPAKAPMGAVKVPFGVSMTVPSGLTKQPPGVPKFPPTPM